jgi:hypothetical protein
VEMRPINLLKISDMLADGRENVIKDYIEKTVLL